MMAPPTTTMRSPRLKSSPMRGGIASTRALAMAKTEGFATKLVESYGISAPQFPSPVPRANNGAVTAQFRHLINFTRGVSCALQRAVAREIGSRHDERSAGQ